MLFMSKAVIKNEAMFPPGSLGRNGRSRRQTKEDRGELLGNLNLGHAGRRQL